MSAEIIAIIGTAIVVVSVVLASSRKLGGEIRADLRGARGDIQGLRGNIRDLLAASMDQRPSPADPRFTKE